MVVVRSRGQCRRFLTAAAVIATLGGFAGQAAAFEINFDESFITQTGQVIDDEYALNSGWLDAGDAGLTATFSAIAASGFGAGLPEGAARPLVVYDTEPQFGGADPDLEAPFNGQANPHAGNVLIFQEWDGDDFGDCGVGSTACATPDDEGQRPVGTATITFNKSVSLSSIMAFDIESGEDSQIKLFSDMAATNLINTINVPIIGDDMYTTIAINQGGVYAMQIIMGGSGAFDKIVGSVEHEEVPEPISLVLLGSGLLASIAIRRRRFLSN